MFTNAPLVLASSLAYVNYSKIFLCVEIVLKLICCQDTLNLWSLLTILHPSGLFFNTQFMNRFCWKPKSSLKIWIESSLVARIFSKSAFALSLHPCLCDFAIRFLKNNWIHIKILGNQEYWHYWSIAVVTLLLCYGEIRQMPMVSGSF